MKQDQSFTGPTSKLCLSLHLKHNCWETESLPIHFLIYLHSLYIQDTQRDSGFIFYNGLGSSSPRLRSDNKILSHFTFCSQTNKPLEVLKLVIYKGSWKSKSKCPIINNISCLTELVYFAYIDHLVEPVWVFFCFRITYIKLYIDKQTWKTCISETMLQGKEF